jgi:hypothetical protein
MLPDTIRPTLPVGMPLVGPFMSGFYGLNRLQKSDNNQTVVIWDSSVPERLNLVYFMRVALISGHRYCLNRFLMLASVVQSDTASVGNPAGNIYNNKCMNAPSRNKSVPSELASNTELHTGMQDLSVFLLYTVCP